MQHQLELAGLKRDWIEDSAPRVAILASGLGEFTADDLHDRLPAPQELLAKLKNQGVIERINARTSKRPSANGRLVSVWRVTGRVT